MNLDDYQQGALETALGRATGRHAEVYLALKLNGEAGEVAEIIGKWMRGDFGDFSDDWIPLRDRERLAKELGDVLWYLAVLAHRIDWPLSEVAAANLAKLHDRKERGVLQGSGSDR